MRAAMLLGDPLPGNAWGLSARSVAVEKMKTLGETVRPQGLTVSMSEVLQIRI
jgi:hypothetical protein